MNDEAKTAGKGARKRPAPDARLANQFARAMWNIEQKGQKFANAKERADKFAEDRKAYRLRAVTLIRGLQKVGVELIPAPQKAASDAE